MNTPRMTNAAHNYALLVLAAYCQSQENAVEVFQQYWPYDPEEETDLQYVYRCAAELDFSEGEDSLVYLDLWRAFVASRAQAPASEEPQDQPQYRNEYRCTCGCEWDDVWSCQCNDRCPNCNKEIEPHTSTELTD